MKMRAVIEAGRKASPLVNKELAWMADRLSRCAQLLEDMAVVKSDLSKSAIAAECAHEVESLKGSFAALVSAWESFDKELGLYKYKGRARHHAPADLPGQMILSDEFLQTPRDASEGGTPA